jgi:hypothetical protein
MMQIIMDFDLHEVDLEIQKVSGELQRARELAARLEATLDWLRQGRELYGGSRADAAAGLPLRKPTLTQAILKVIGDGPQSEWTAPEVMNQLRARGWMPNGSSAEHVVRARLASLARGDDAVLSRVSHGVYALSGGGS